MTLKLSLEKALKALTSLGLLEVDAKLYVYLAKKGPHGKKDLANALNLTKHKLCLILDRLVTRGIVLAVPEQTYYAVPFEKVLDEFLKTSIEEVRDLEAKRQAILDVWRSTNVKS
jgi:sugar-specific transcriptional regulator TrmB